MSNEKVTILYERLSREDMRDDESISIAYQDFICQGEIVPFGTIKMIKMF